MAALRLPQVLPSSGGSRQKDLALLASTISGVGQQVLPNMIFKLALHHLPMLGHPRIGAVCPLDMPDTRERKMSGG